MDQLSKIEESYLYDLQKVSILNSSIKNTRGFQYTWTQSLSTLQKPDPLPQALKAATLIENSLLDLSTTKRISKKNRPGVLTAENTPMPRRSIINFGSNPNFRRKFHSTTVVASSDNTPVGRRNINTFQSGIWEHYEDLGQKLDAISHHKVNLRDILSDKKSSSIQDEKYVKDLFSTENIFSETTLNQLKTLDEKVRQMKNDLKRKRFTRNIRSQSSGNLSIIQNKSLNSTSTEFPKLSYTPQAYQSREIPKFSAVKLQKYYK
ncbi:unnamed protein product [Blepharisma stoltei]|uniref:Uncharacterized protein n=1 Tax=Blepharisma stoltei TaxID=1481888 RepID=A0AAU9IQ19_9CILI|nr:unnamed protein product [Blepharisma stoltei]